jgi:hypothetical protein
MKGSTMPDDVPILLSPDMAEAQTLEPGRGWLSCGDGRVALHPGDALYSPR